ncbi:hypothetical protein ACH4Y0_02840 [Streptomyces sp. NPDC020707]
MCLPVEMDGSTCSGGELGKVIDHVTEEQDRCTPSSGRYRSGA